MISRIVGALVEPTPVAVDGDADSLAIERNLVLLWIFILAYDCIKINDTVSDYFIMVRGVWVSSGKILLIISVYASQDFSEKKMLWDYLSFVIGNWDSEVVIIGDFNEVRDISERFGSIFNKHGAEAFNSFIVNTGLVEVPL
nr:RNA-directed DNA polymerase, eukaryota [Tanacetum cinerariifolium]